MAGGAWPAAAEVAPIVASLFVGLRRHANSEVAIQAVCLSLMALVERMGGKGRVDVVRIPELSSVGQSDVAALVAALRTLCGDAGVYCIIGLLLDCTAAVDASSAWAVEAGGVEAVVAAMRAQPTSFEVQGGGCAVLRVVTARGLGQGRIVAAGGLQLAVAAKKAHGGEHHAILLNGVVMLLQVLADFRQWERACQAGVPAALRASRAAVACRLPSIVECMDQVLARFDTNAAAADAAALLAEEEAETAKEVQLAAKRARKQAGKSGGGAAGASGSAAGGSGCAAGASAGVIGVSSCGAAGASSAGGGSSIVSVVSADDCIKPPSAVPGAGQPGAASSAAALLLDAAAAAAPSAAAEPAAAAAAVAAAAAAAGRAADRRVEGGAQANAAAASSSGRVQQPPPVPPAAAAAGKGLLRRAGSTAAVRPIPAAAPTAAASAAAAAPLVAPADESKNPGAGFDADSAAEDEEAHQKLLAGFDAEDEAQARGATTHLLDARISRGARLLLWPARHPACCGAALS